MEDSTSVPPPSWRKDIVDVKAEPKTEPKKNMVAEFLARVDTVMGGARKAANVLVSTCVVFLIMGVGFGACMVWYNFERRHEFGIAAAALKEKDPEAGEVLEELGQVCRNDAHLPRSCEEMRKKLPALRPQLARVER